MAIILGTERQQQHATLEYRTLWIQTGSVFTWTRQRRTNTTSTWRAVLGDMTYPSPIGSGTEMTGKSMTPRKNGWYDYEETWVTYGTWTDVAST